MNPHQITTLTAPTDDSRILSLFHDWLELYRAAESMPSTIEGNPGNPEFDAAVESLDAIATEAIAQVPAAGAVGIAIKAFLRLQIDPAGIKSLRPLESSILEGAAHFVPELAPLVADMLARAARQGGADAEPQESRCAASDGLTEAERRLVETLGPKAALYEAALARKRESPPGEIGFGEPDARDRAASSSI